jgi:hypothetical protein
MFFYSKRNHAHCNLVIQKHKNKSEVSIEISSIIESYVFNVIAQKIKLLDCDQFTFLELNAEFNIKLSHSFYYIKAKKLKDCFSFFGFNSEKLFLDFLFLANDFETNPSRKMIKAKFFFHQSIILTCICRFLVLLSTY